MSGFREFLEALLWGEHPMRRKPAGPRKPDPIERLSKCWHTGARDIFRNVANEPKKRPQK